MAQKIAAILAGTLRPAGARVKDIDNSIGAGGPWKKDRAGQAVRPAKEVSPPVD
jgi:hypothetical protein